MVGYQQHWQQQIHAEPECDATHGDEYAARATELQWKARPMPDTLERVPGKINPFAPPTGDSAQPAETNIGRSATWAAVLAAIGVLLWTPVGLIGWFFGRRALKAIRLRQTGYEHRAAAQVGVVSAWVCLGLTVFRVALWLGDR
jgi:hypothetical protein